MAEVELKCPNCGVGHKRLQIESASFILETWPVQIHHGKHPVPVATPPKNHELIERHIISNDDPPYIYCNECFASYWIEIGSNGEFRIAGLRELYLPAHVEEMKANAERKA